MRKDARHDDAWWDADVAAWVHGARDAEGRLAGEVRYWDADGVLRATAEYVAGARHGLARRYHRDGAIASECPYVDGKRHGVATLFRSDGPMADILTDLPPSVVCYESVFEADEIVGSRLRDDEGREVDGDGSPIPARPPGVPPTAEFFRIAWRYARRSHDTNRPSLERSYDLNGQLRREQNHVDGRYRTFHANGQLECEGSVSERCRAVGTWNYYDDSGRLVCVETYAAGYAAHRTWYRSDGTTREGAVDRDVEVGSWIVGDRTVELGPAMTDAELLAHDASADVLPDAIPGDRSLAGTLACARRAGRTRDLACLDLVSGPRWPFTDEPRHGLVAEVAALRWSPDDAELLARIAAELFRGDRARAALDVIDAALLLEERPAWRTSRIAYQRGTGMAVDVPSQLDDRALHLLDEIARHPDDNAPRVVFADHVAAAFPEHSVLVVAQCAGRDASDLVEAFVATLPRWLAERHPVPVRGFIDSLPVLAGADFVHADPDLLLRVAPACRRLALADARAVVAHLVTLPHLARYAELHFDETTTITPTSACQLASCRHLANLEYLGLHRTRLDDEALVALCSGSAYPRLRGLDIGHVRDDMRYTLAGLRAVTEAAFASSLRSLRLHNLGLGDGVVELLARLPALVELDLEGGALGDAGARALLELANAWRMLCLSSHEISADLQRRFVARLGDRVRFAP